MRTPRKVEAGILGVSLLLTVEGCSAPSHESSAPRTIASATAHASTSPSGSSANCATLNSLNLIGGDKKGGENAKNTGTCAAVYYPAEVSPTQHTVGQIASGQAFVIECTSIQPTSLRVEVGIFTGFINLGGLALTQFNQRVFTTLPVCA